MPRATYLDTQHVRSFVEVAREGNITRAAARLYMTQQAVSQHVKQLEQELGVDLLIRQTKGVLLTEAGRELAARGTELLSHLDEVRQRVVVVAQRARRRTLRLAAGIAATSVIAPIAEAMETAFGMDVEVIAVPSQSVGTELLATGQADAAFMWLPIGTGRFQHAVVRTDRRLVALPASHPLARREAVTLADLADEPVIMPDVFGSPEAVSHWLVDPRPDGAPAVRGPYAPGIMEALMLVARGRGIWLAPQPVEHWSVVPGVTWLPVLDAEPTSAAVLWRPDAPRDLMTSLVAEVRKAIRSGPEHPEHGATAPGAWSAPA
jgi:DNA-binding transcriptional LysR family regulator